MCPTLSLFGSIVIPNVAHPVNRNPINRQRKATLMRMIMIVVGTNRNIVQSISDNGDDDDGDDDDDYDYDCDCDYDYDEFSSNNLSES